MSGGVDSSVAAALLKKAGYKVTGVFIKVWEPPDFACDWREERRDAMRVAAVLDIPLVTIDLSKEYERDVVRQMIREYRVGRTPNPDVECNRAIKFGAFYAWALTNGADYVATGHYARIAPINFASPGQRGKVETKSVGAKLLAARDKNKDQSYFLWPLTQEQLKHCLFPIGKYKKSFVRKLAKKFNLPTAEKKDSQGLCFLGRLDVKKFLQKYIKPKKGKVLDASGKVVGEHEGVWFYTIGEHHYGYIVGKDTKKNLLFVSHQPPKLDTDKIVRLENVNWIAGKLPALGRRYRARIRHRGELYSCRLTKAKNNWQVTFSKSSLAVASGQSLVLYDNEVCLGGGAIV